MSAAVLRFERTDQEPSSSSGCRENGQKSFGSELSILAFWPILRFYTIDRFCPLPGEIEGSRWYHSNRNELPDRLVPSGAFYLVNSWSYGRKHVSAGYEECRSFSLHRAPGDEIAFSGRYSRLLLRVANKDYTLFSISDIMPESGRRHVA